MSLYFIAADNELQTTFINSYRYHKWKSKTELADELFLPPTLHSSQMQGVVVRPYIFLLQGVKLGHSSEQ